jgi:hypothetical protein
VQTALKTLTVSSSRSIHVKEDKIRLLEEQLQHEVASKMEELKVCELRLSRQLHKSLISMALNVL